MSKEPVSSASANRQLVLVLPSLPVDITPTWPVLRRSQLQVVPTAAVIVDLEKRKGLSKYYVSEDFVCEPVISLCVLYVCPHLWVISLLLHVISFGTVTTIGMIHRPT